MAKIFPVDFEEKLTMAQDDYILFSDSEDGNKIKKAQYSNLKWEQGDPGTPGADWAAATITVGTVTTWVPGSSATVTNSGTSSAAVLNFSIPQWATGTPWADWADGADGADWEAATITVGTTTTLSPWSSATVTNVGTSSAAILNFWIPQGTPWTWTGDVVWPASSTDGHLAVFDWATGKLIKDWGSVPTSFAPDSAGTQWQVLTKWASGYDWATVSGWDVQVSTDTGNLLSTGVKLWLGDKADFESLGSLDANTLYAPIEWMWGGGWDWTWQPTDAKCWYKFDWTYSDDTGTYGDATGTSTFVALDSWCNVLQTDGTNLVLLPSALTSTAMTTYTVAFWVKIITTSPAYWYYAWSWASNGAMMCFYESTGWRNYFEWWLNGNNNNRDITPTGIWADWRLICLRSNWTGRSNVSLIINWQYNIASWWTGWSDTSSIFGYANWGQFAIWGRYPNASGSGQVTSIQMSSFVISTSYWDDATCLAMYEWTKSNYGIS